jgi:hypothetical protein
MEAVGGVDRRDLSLVNLLFLHSRQGTGPELLRTGLRSCIWLVGRCVKGNHAQETKIRRGLLAYFYGSCAILVNHGWHYAKGAIRDRTELSSGDASRRR